MPKTQALWTFSIVSNQRSSGLAGKVRKIMLTAGHKEIKIEDDPRIIIVVGMEKTIQVPIGLSDTAEWLRAVINGLEFGGTAVLFCQLYLTTKQLALFLTTGFPRHHGARKLVIPFKNALELLPVIKKIPANFATGSRL